MHGRQPMMTHDMLLGIPNKSNNVRSYVYSQKLCIYMGATHCAINPSARSTRRPYNGRLV